MKREILFRGKRVDNGEWVYGDLVVNRPTGTYRIWVDFANVKHGDYAESQLHECSGQLFIVIPETVGQYTGLWDNCKNKLWEGDKVKILYTDWPSKSENDPRTLDQYLEDISLPGEIVFLEDSWCVKFPSGNYGSIMPGTHGFIKRVGLATEKQPTTQNQGV